ncbi:MAG: C4-dicarboxylate TRAP transporter substrate-binding protein [Alphaproteobacteria bacterium]
MKTTGAVPFVLALVVLALASLAFSAPADAVTEIRAAVGAPPKHPMVTPGYTWYTDAVEKASGGQIKFRTFYGGQLFSLTGSLQGLKSGVADMTCLVLPYWPAEFPHGKFVNDIAMIGTDPVAMAGAVAEFNHLNCKDCLAEFAAQNSVYMGPYSTDVFYLTARTRITTLDEFKGKKIRSGGGNWTRWIQALGGVPVSLAGDEIYQGLSGGVLDASVNSVANLQGYSLWDVATDEILLPVGTFHSINLYNFRKDFWQKLSAAERKVLMDHVPRGIVETTILYIKQAEDVIAPAKAKESVFTNRRLLFSRPPRILSSRIWTLSPARQRGSASRTAGQSSIRCWPWSTSGKTCRKKRGAISTS